MHLAALLGHEEILCMVKSCDPDAALTKDYLGLTPDEYEQLAVAHKTQNGPWMT